MLKLKHRLSGHKAAVYALCKGGSAGEFFTTGGDGYVVKWQVNQPGTGLAVANAGVQLFSIAFHPELQLIIAGDMNGGIHWIDLENPGNIKASVAHSCGVFSILPMGGQILSGGGKGKLNIWSAAHRELEKSIQITDTSIRNIVHSSLRNEIALACSDNNIYLLDAQEMAVKQVINQAHENSVFTLAYSESGMVLYSGGRDAFLNAWQLEPEPQLVRSIPAHNFTINALTLIADGKYLVSASRDKTIKLWDAENLELLKVLEPGRDKGHFHSVNGLLWLMDEQLLASVSDDKSILLWEMEQQ